MASDKLVITTWITGFKRASTVRSQTIERGEKRNVDAEIQTVCLSAERGKADSNLGRLRSTLGTLVGATLTWCSTVQHPPEPRDWLSSEMPKSPGW